MAGISRSAAVCIAFLMRYKDWDVEKAFDFLKDKRPCVAPNLSFMGQLLAFQQQLCTTEHLSFDYANSESDGSFHTMNKQKEAVKASSKSNTNVKNEDKNLSWSPAVTERTNDACHGRSYKFSLEEKKRGLKLLIPAR